LDLIYEGFDPTKTDVNARIKALDSEDETLGPKRGVWTLEMSAWKLKKQLGP